MAPTVEDLRATFTWLTQRVMRQWLWIIDRGDDDEDKQQWLVNKKMAIRTMAWSEGKQEFLDW